MLMKKRMSLSKFGSIALMLCVTTILLFFVSAKEVKNQGKDNPWTKEQVMEPAVLAEMLKTKSTETPVIVCIGPSASIPGSIDFGPAKEQSSMVKMRTALGSSDKNKAIVIYCGCCPFENCPNIRPAFTLLKNMGFRKPYLLNLSTNMKTDWIDKGYPLNH